MTERIDRVRSVGRYFGIIALVITAIAQQAPQKTKHPALQSDEPTRIQVDVTRVNMLFTVTDKKGRFITNLNREDFEVIENRIPQVIQEFTAETGQPLRLGILIDISGSIRDRFRFEQYFACGTSEPHHSDAHAPDDRLTNAFSKKWDNLKAAYALHFTYYNFCRVHQTLRTTPAMAAGLTNHVWTLAELLAGVESEELCSKREVC
jgi:hypothetical protein